MLWHTAHEENDASSVGNVSHEIKCISEQDCSLIQVYDQVTEPRAKYKWLHALIEGPFSMSQVNTGIEQVFNIEQICNVKIVWLH